MQQAFSTIVECLNNQYMLILPIKFVVFSNNENNGNKYELDKRPQRKKKF